MFKKFLSVILVLAMALAIVGCVSNDPNVTELSGNTVTTNPGGDTGGVDPGTTQPADPGSDGPSKPVDPVDPSEPTPSEPDVPTVPSEPVGPVDPVDPSEPNDPVDPSEPVHEHSYSEEVTEATCTEDGFTTYACKCGDVYVGNKVTATGHSWGEWVTTKEPTEETTGEAIRSCANCEEKEVKTLDKVIPNHTHSYTGKVTTAATCTKEGVKTYTCSCGGSYTESIEKIPHSYKTTVTKPTCTDKGYTTYKCSSCGDSYKDDYVAAKGHSYGNYKSNGDATCTKDGTKTGSCSACGAKNTLTDTGSAKGHSYKATVTAPTCTEKGYTTNKCSVCGDSYKDSYVNATGHKFGSYTSNGDATCTKDGTKTATCSNGCGTKDTKTDVGTALGHSYTATGTTPAKASNSILATRETVIIQGYTTYTCGKCGDNYKDDYTNISLEEFQREVAKATIKYINQYRKEQGDTAAIYLPGLSLVTEYRAVQLSTNFDHDTLDLREALAYYQYGKWIDNTAYGGSAYYDINSPEAIALGTYSGTADRIGELFATAFQESENHWNYVGASKYTYIGVGSYFDDVSGCWYCCVIVSRTNYG